MRTNNAVPASDDPSEVGFSIERHFDQMADHYDAGFGTVWRNVADQMLQLNPVAISAQSVIHDNGCGTGQVTERVTHALGLQQRPASEWPQIYATDLSEAMIRELTKGQVLKDNAKKIRPLKMDSMALGFPDAFFSHSFASLLLMVLPDPVAACKEIFRTLKPGGVSIASTWSSFGYATIVERAIAKVRPDLKGSTYTAPIPPGWDDAQALKDAFVNAGFDAGSVEVLRGRTRVIIADIQAGRNHFCSSISLQVAADWSQDDRTRLYSELVRNFTPGTAPIDGFDQDPWICVARK